MNADQNPSRKRRRASSPRAHGVLVRVSDSERERLRFLASERGISVPALLMTSALAGSSEDALRWKILTDELQQALRLQSRIGTVLNQIARHANTTGDVLPQVNRILARLDKATAAIEAVVFDLQRRSQ